MLLIIMSTPISDLYAIKKELNRITAQIKFLKEHPAKAGLPAEKLNALIAKNKKGKKTSKAHG